MFYRADASIAGEATGAMSWAFISALKKNPQQSYVQLLNSIREELEGKYDQKPQLSCSHPLNVGLLYVMWAGQAKYGLNEGLDGLYFEGWTRVMSRNNDGMG